MSGESVIDIQTEPFSAGLFAEILPLAKKCWAESTEIKADTCAFYGDRDFEIEPDFDAYQRLADNGVMAIVTLRADGKLVGYVLGFAYRAMHHKHVLGGIADNIYIEPPYRTYAPVLAKRFEKEMERLGVGIIGWPAHPNGPLYELLKSLGYVGDDVVMEKRICV